MTEGRLCGYDVDLGFWQVAVPVEEHADLTEVGPKVFECYLPRGGAQVSSSLVRVVHDPVQAVAVKAWIYPAATGFRPLS